jgi:hypothetical protein
MSVQPNRPLRWTIQPQRHWYDINEPFVRRLTAERQGVRIIVDDGRGGRDTTAFVVTVVSS